METLAELGAYPCSIPGDLFVTNIQRRMAHEWQQGPSTVSCKERTPPA
jgi:hypothetical protein